MDLMYHLPLSAPDELHSGLCPIGRERLEVSALKYSNIGAIDS